MRSPLAKSAKYTETDFEKWKLFLPTQYLRTNFTVLFKFKPYSWSNYNTYAENDKFFNHFKIYMFKFWT